MSIDRWAERIATEISIAGDERPPMDAVLLAHMDEFDELMRSTRLKIPAFARALTRAGVTLKSGKPYSAETLRAQVNRARTKRATESSRSETGQGQPAERLRQETELSERISPPTQSAQTRTGSNKLLAQLERLKPKRPAILDPED